MHKSTNTKKAPAKGSLLSRLLLILGSLLLAAALIIGGYLIWQYVDAQNRYNDIRTTSGLEVSSPELVDSNLQLEDLVFDWDALRALNADTVAWIIVPGTNINYPVVQGTDNSYYLYHLFDSTSSGSGTVFVDSEGSATLDGLNNIIYGHNMFDGSMFSDVLMYTSQEYFDNHRVVYLCTPQRNYELSAIAAINVSADAPLREFNFKDQEAFTDYVSEILALPEASSPDLQTTIAEAESVYQLLTCETYDASRRIVLCCVPVRSVEPNA